jgi:hypothetical protein
MNIPLQDALNASSGHIPSKYINVIKSLLMSVFEARKNGLEAIEMRTLVPGLSGAGVMLVESRSFGTPDIPLVVKYGAADLIGLEEGKYREYVEPKLRTAARLLHTCIETSVGAVAYQLAGTAKEHADVLTLRTFFETSDEDDMHVAMLLNVLDDLESWITGVKKAPDLIISTFNLYRPIPENTVSIYVSDLSKRFATVHDLQKVWDAICHRWPYQGYYAAIQHGDLNAGNVIIDKSSNRSYLIDFASVAPRASVFHDLSKLTREILLRLYRFDAAAGSVDDYLDSLEWLLFPVCNFLEQKGRPPPERRLELPKLEGAFHLMLNVPNAMYRIIDGLEENDGAAAAHQATAEALLATFFQCLLLLLPAPGKPAGQELGAAYVCHRLHEMLSAHVPELAS